MLSSDWIPIYTLIIPWSVQTVPYWSRIFFLAQNTLCITMPYFAFFNIADSRKEIFMIQLRFNFWSHSEIFLLNERDFPVFYIFVSLTTLAFVNKKTKKEWIKEEINEIYNDTLNKNSPSTSMSVSISGASSSPTIGNRSDVFLFISNISLSSGHSSQNL